MTWSDTIQEQFDLINRSTTDESEYYGPYNTLLTDVFPHSEHYQIAPQFKGPMTPGFVYFTTIYIVRKYNRPVMFIQIKTSISLNDKGTRELADRQMRDRFDHLIDSLSIPFLYGLSVMGSRYAVYKYEKDSRRLTPTAIPRDPEFVNDVAPAERWEHELMEPEGEQAFRTIVQHVKSMCAAITGRKSHRLFLKLGH